MKKYAFSYAEAMVTMLIVAIIMVASTPILTKKMSTNKGSIWTWAADNVSTFFGNAQNQRVIIGNHSAFNIANESARLVLFTASNSAGVANLTPLIHFYDGANGNDLGKLIATHTTLGLGSDALKEMIADNNNTAIGAQALQNATGNNNTALGFNACGNVTGGSNNICIGNNAGPTNDDSNKLYIGTLIEGDMNANTVTINGRLLLPPSGGGAAQDIYTTIDNMISAVASDARLKNINGGSNAGLAEINKIQVKKFTYKNDKKKEPHVGVIAQELIKIFPNSVKKGEDGYYKVNRDEMFFAMINAIKELGAKVSQNDENDKKMQQQIDELKQENADLKQKIAEIELKMQEK